MGWTSALWGIFALGMVACVLGSVPWKAAGLCQCCCRAALGLSLSPVTCAAVPAPVTPCARLLQRVLGFRHHKSPPPGAETPSQRTSVTLPQGQLQGGRFFAPLAAQQLLQRCPGRACAGASRSIPVPVVSVPPLQDLCNLGWMPKPLNCSPEPCVLIPFQFCGVQHPLSIPS